MIKSLWALLILVCSEVPGMDILEERRRLRLRLRLSELRTLFKHGYLRDLTSSDTTSCATFSNWKKLEKGRILVALELEINA